MRRLVALLLAAGAGASPRLAAACAGCRNPNLPITRLANVALAPGQVRASAVLSATTINVVHEAGCVDVASCAEVPAQPRYLHDQDLVPGELRAIAEVGLTPSWGLEAQLPFRVTRTTIRYATPGGAPYTPLDPDVHHRDETLAGLGDPWLLARYGALAGGLLVTARAGVSVPLGRTEPDPFALGAVGKRHQHIQFGTGTFDPVLALDASRTIGRLQLGGYGQAQLSLYENDEGFRAGHRLAAGLSAGTRVLGSGAGALVGALGLDVMHEGAERWGGEVQQDGNLGRTELLAGLTATQPLGRTLLSLVVRVPVYRHVVAGDRGDGPGRLSSPVSLSAIVSRAF